MKIRVWCRSDQSKVGGVRGKLIWQGELEVVPHIDEFLFVYPGWAAERVLAVYYDLWDQSVVIEVNPDYNNEYPVIIS